MRHSIQIIAFLVVAILLTAATAKAQVYRNEEFGIVVTVPEGVFLCPKPEEVHDHGPLFLLGPSNPKSCFDSERGRFITIFAGYNAADETKKLPDLLYWDCVDVAKGPCGPAPSGLQITGLSSEAGRVNRPDGWIDIFVVTQAGTPDPTYDTLVPSVNYDLWLHTKKEYFEEDLRIFRKILDTIRISPK